MSEAADSPQTWPVLEHIRLENVRSIHDMDLAFEMGEDQRSWCVLLGENGTGKSTVLRAIALAMSGSDALAELVKEPGTWVRHGQKSATIEATLRGASGEPRKVKLVLERDATLGQMIRRNTRGLKALDGALEKGTQSYFMVGYGASRRLAPPNLSRASAYASPRAAGVQTMFDRESRLNSLEQWALDIDYDVRTAMTSESDASPDDGLASLDIIKNTLNGLLEGVSFSGIAPERRELLFDTENGTVPLEQLSDGFQNMAGWLGDLLFRITQAFGHSKEPLNTRGLLLLDELGLHLHPLIQRKLMAKVREQFPYLQVVATSHSPLIVGAMHKHELMVVRREEGRVRVQRPEVSPYGLTVDQVLASPLFGLDSLRTPAFDKELAVVRRRAAAGDFDAADQLSRMVAHGAGWDGNDRAAG